MISRDSIIQIIADHLRISEYDDVCVNGIQVEGSETVRRIVTGVSVSRALLDEAVARKAEMVVVHHGLFWKSFASPIALRGLMRQRLGLLMSHDITLAAFHLPLDAHADIGNNAQILKNLGFPIHERFDVGFLSRLPEEIQPDDLKRRIDELLPSLGTMYGNRSKPVSSVAVVSGAAGHMAEKAAAAGAGAFITGEVSEPAVRIAEELGLCLIRAGHYNTERFGPIALTGFLADRLGIPVEFVDIPNEV